KSYQACVKSSAVIVAGYFGQSRQVGASIYGQQCVKAASGCTERHDSIGWRAPTNPHRFASALACVIGLGRLFGSSDITGGPDSGHASQNNPIAQIVGHGQWID